MNKNISTIGIFITITVALLMTISALRRANVFKARTQGTNLPSNTIVIPVFISPNPTQNNLQLQTFPFVTTTPTPIPPTLVPQTTSGVLPTNNPSNSPVGKQYCVDEAPGTVTIESCDDPTRCDIAHGGGGPSGLCGTVIGWEHKIIETLLSSSNNTYFNRLSTDLTIAIQSNCYTASPVTPYISTFNVIDAYSLAGFNAFSRGPQALATALESAWRATTGYTILTTANDATPGYAIFFNNPPHVALLNTIEVDARGNGDIWFLHTGATYYLGKLIIANWQVVASSTGDNNVIFGGHQSGGPDATIGETVCYCESGVCYRYTF